jgi:hypothetical protein
MLVNVGANGKLISHSSNYNKLFADNYRDKIMRNHNHGNKQNFRHSNSHGTVVLTHQLRCNESSDFLTLTFPPHGGGYGKRLNRGSILSIELQT